MCSSTRAPTKNQREAAQMKAMFAFGCLVLLVGCGGPYKISVYGKSGATFTAPALCAALVQCLNSKETSCFYDRNLMQTATGQQEVEECKEVKK
jgi:hypothetical protein